MSNSKELETKLGKAKAHLILEQPFHASILCNMPLIERTNLPFPTMGTDGKAIYWHPEFVEKCSMDELKFTLCHEVMHNVFAHMFRRGERNRKGWNIAGDYIINDILINEKIGSMPHGGLHNPSLVQQGNGTTDGVYDLLPQDQKQGGYGPGEGDGWDNCEDNYGSEAERSEAEAQMKVMVAQAAQAAKMCGKLSDGMARFVEAALKPKIDWRTVLHRFMNERAKVDYTFARPKRRFLGEDLYLPSLSGTAMGVITVSCDCSGSISIEEQRSYFAEINAIKQLLNPRQVVVKYFHTKVFRIETYGPDDELVFPDQLETGGTDFTDLFDMTDEQCIEPPVCSVVLTDLYAGFGPPPSYPVLWITTGSTQAPFGEVVEMNPKQ